MYMIKINMKKSINLKAADKKIISIIGLGYVGLPLLLAFEKKKIKQVIGIDSDPKKIEILKSGKSYISDVKLKKFKNKKVLFTENIELVKKSDFIIICLPTPLNKKKEPDLSIVKNSLKSITPFLRKDQTIILESTTYPGTTKELLLPIIEKSKLKVGKNIFLAFSPERINPGSKFPINKIPKIVGADDIKSLNKAKLVYNLIFQKVYLVNSSSVAEAVKLTENIFRSVNIALVNELKIIFDKMGIDIWDVIKLAKTKPFGFMPFYPGPGLGGHCIPIDPFYLTWKAKKFGIDTKLIKLSGKINSSMPNYVVGKIIEAIKNNLNKKISEVNIFLIGLAYKKNTNDLRESPSVEIINQLEKKNISTYFFDPYISKINNMRNYPNLSGKQGIKLNKTNLMKADMTVIITDHDNIKFSLIAKYSKIIVDTRNVMEKNKFNGILIKS